MKTLPHHLVHEIIIAEQSLVHLRMINERSEQVMMLQDTINRLKYILQKLEMDSSE